MMKATASRRSTAYWSCSFPGAWAYARGWEHDPDQVAEMGQSGLSHEAHDSGLRAREVAGLRWFRINFESRSVAVADVMQDDSTLRGFPNGKKAST